MSHFYKKNCFICPLLPPAPPCNYSRIRCLPAISKRSLTWLAKVASMDENRLPKICMDKQASLLTRDSLSETWLSRIHGSCNAGNIFPNLTNWQLVDWKALRNPVASYQFRASFKEAWSSAINSKHSPQYCLLRRPDGQYLSTIRLARQLRCEASTII